MATIIVQQEFDTNDLAENLWSGAVDTWRHIEEAGKEEEALAFLNEIFCDKVPTLTEINDILWLEPETVYEAIGLNENGEEQQEWSINRGELDELKSREILSQEQIEYIEGEFYGDCYLAYVSEQDFIDNGIELDDAQKEELNEIVA